MFSDGYINELVMNVLICLHTRCLHANMTFVVQVLYLLLRRRVDISIKLLKNGITLKLNSFFEMTLLQFNVLKVHYGFFF